MFTKGHIIVKRTIKEWGWYHNPNMLAFWVHLLVEANYKDGEWEGITIKRGQLVTSMTELAKDVGLSYQEVRTILKRLGASGEVRSRTIGKRTILTICNYDDYQSEQQDSNNIATSSQQVPNNETTSSQQAIIEEGNKGIIKEDSVTSGEKKKTVKRFVPPTVEEVRAYCSEHGYNIDAQRFVDYYQQGGWVYGKAHTPMKDWKAAARQWNSRNNNSGYTSSLFSPEQSQPDSAPNTKQQNTCTLSEIKLWFPRLPEESEHDYNDRIACICKAQEQDGVIINYEE